MVTPRAARGGKFKDGRFDDLRSSRCQSWLTSFKTSTSVSISSLLFISVTAMSM